MPRTTLQAIDAEIKQLEAQKKLIEKRDGEVPKAIEVLQHYAKVLSAVQRRKIARIIGEVVDTATPGKAPRAKKQGRKLGRSISYPAAKLGAAAAEPLWYLPRGKRLPKARLGARPTRVRSSPPPVVQPSPVPRASPA